MRPGLPLTVVWLWTNQCASLVIPVLHSRASYPQALLQVTKTQRKRAFPLPDPVSEIPKICDWSLNSSYSQGLWWPQLDHLLTAVAKLVLHGGQNKAVDGWYLVPSVYQWANEWRWLFQVRRAISKSWLLNLCETFLICRIAVEKLNRGGGFTPELSVGEVFSSFV